MHCIFLSGADGTRSRDRTGMEVNPLVFETSASTNSAIRAIGSAKVVFFLISAMLPLKFFTNCLLLLIPIHAPFNI